MKIELYLLMIASLLCSCGEEKPSNAQSTAKGPDASKAVLPPTIGNMPQASKPIDPFVPGDSVPPMDALGEGSFSPKGLADAFQNATGWPMPDYVKPVEGKYRVWNEKDFGGRNRAHHTATFAIPSEKAATLADAIAKTWRDKYGKNRDFEITRAQLEHDYTEGSRTFHKGSIGLGLNEKYATYKTADFSISIDPVAGQLSLRSYRGTEDTPAEREKPEAQ